MRETFPQRASFLDNMSKQCHCPLVEMKAWNQDTPPRAIVEPPSLDAAFRGAGSFQKFGCHRNK